MLESFCPGVDCIGVGRLEAYWPLTAGEKGWVEKLSDLIKIMPSLSKELVAQSLVNACHQLGLPKDKGSLLRSELQSVNRSLSGYWKRVAIIAGVGTVAGALTFGIAAPFIGGLIGHTMGLAGAGCRQGRTGCYGRRGHRLRGNGDSWWYCGDFWRRRFAWDGSW